MAVVEDEPRYVRVMRVSLEMHGYKVLTAGDGVEAVRLVQAKRPNLVLLDLRLPRMSGYEACEQIRRFSDVPIIMVTALADEADKVRGLDLGADDYLTKPFGIDELLARVRAVLRRHESNLLHKRPLEPKLCYDDLVIDVNRGRAFRGGVELPLTPTEYRLLTYMASNANRLLVPEEVLRHVWGPAHEAALDCLKTGVCRLRQKIEPDPKRPRHILTRRGLGYIFAA